MNVLENHLNKNNVVSVSTEVKQDNIQVEQKVETKKDGKKLLFAGAVAAAAIGGAVVLMSKGKAKPSDVQKAGKKAVQEIANNIPQKANNVADDVAEVVTDKVDDVVDVVLPKIKDIKFDKGVAFKDGEKFTGIIEDTLKNGKKVILEYQDGVIQKSTKDGVEKVIDHKAVKELSQKAKAQHDKLVKILADNDKLSLDDFTKQVDEIKFKSKSDLSKIEEIKSSKLKAIEEAKIQAEKLRIQQLETLKKTEADNEKILRQDIEDIFKKQGLDGDDLVAAVEKELASGEAQEILEYGLINGTTVSLHGAPYGFNHILHNGKTVDGAVSVESTFKHLPKTEKEMTVYRGFHEGGVTKGYKKFIDGLKSKQVGDIYTDTGFAYSSFKPSIAEYWSGGNGVVMEIRVPKGAQVSYAKYSEQSECLFNKNSQFKIIDKDSTGKITKFIVEYILPKN